MRKFSLKIFIICLFLIGTTNLYSTTFNIVSTPLLVNEIDWFQFVDDVVIFGGAGNTYILTEDVGPGSPISADIREPLGDFYGILDGGNHKIKLSIESDEPNVGLFSVISGTGSIKNLIIDGYVIGGASSQNVGGFVGEMLSGNIHNCTNLADVTGESSTSSVGGFIGLVNGSNTAFDICSNSGTITGGQYVAGVIGRILDLSKHSKYLNNSGVIRGNGNNLHHPNYIAGIVAYASTFSHIHNLVNIGMIYSSEFDYAGGLVAYFAEGEISASSNSGIVLGAKNSVGGLVGCLEGGNVYSSINTNWVEPTLGVAPFVNRGAIIGNRISGSVEYCYYDSQMCVVKGINNLDFIFEAEGKHTTEMLGTNLGVSFLNNTNLISQWLTHPQLYPRPNSADVLIDHPINLLSAAPIYLPEDTNTAGIITAMNVSNVTNDFYVSNYESYPPPTYIQITDYLYSWGSYPGGIFNPYSVNGNVSVPAPPSGNASILTRRGWDSLVVRYDYPDYNNNGFYTGYTIIFEKIIPINIR